jgi:hypothetical protein
MSAQSINVDYATAAAYRTLEQIRNRWLAAQPVRPGIEPDQYFGEAMGVYQMWVAVTGDNPATPGRMELYERC